MPVSNRLLLNTAEMMQFALGSNLVNSASVTTETNFVEIITRTIATEYKRFIFIS